MVRFGRFSKNPPGRVPRAASQYGYVGSGGHGWWLGVVKLRGPDPDRAGF